MAMINLAKRRREVFQTRMHELIEGLTFDDFLVAGFGDTFVEAV